MRIIVKKSWLSLLITVYYCVAFQAHAQSLIVIDEQEVEQDTILFKCQENTIFSVPRNTQDPTIDQLEVLKASISNNYRQSVWDFSGGSDLPTCNKEVLDFLFSLAHLCASHSNDFITFDLATMLNNEDGDNSYEIKKLLYGKSIEQLVATVHIARCLGASRKVENILAQGIVRLLLSSEAMLLKQFISDVPLCHLLINLPEDFQLVVKRELLLELKEWYVVFVSMLLELNCLKDAQIIEDNTNLVQHNFQYSLCLGDYHYWPYFSTFRTVDKVDISRPSHLLVNAEFRDYEQLAKNSYLLIPDVRICRNYYYILHEAISRFTLPQIIFLMSLKYNITEFINKNEKRDLCVWDELYTSYHPFIQDGLNKIKAQYLTKNSHYNESIYSESVSRKKRRKCLLM